MKPSDVNIPIDLVRHLFLYDPLTGSIKWNQTRCGTKFGSEAGTEHKGYRRVKVGGHLVLAHRLAWAIYHGKWPDGEIDHINMVRTDNRIENLRDVSRSENMINRHYPKGNSRKRGVSKHKYGWQVSISINGKRKYIGLFKTIEQAHQERLKAEKLIYGEFSPKEN